MDVLAGLLVARAVAVEAEVIQAVLLVAGGSEDIEVDLDARAEIVDTILLAFVGVAA